MHDAMVMEAMTPQAKGAGASMPSMPLTFLKPGDHARVRRVRGADEVRRHLENIGFVSGSAIRLVAAQRGGVIVEVKGAQVALDRASAQKVIVM